LLGCVVSSRVDLLNYRKDGSEFWVEIDMVAVADETGWYTNWIGIQRETTKRREREGQSRLASQMESLGVLSGGIAHDFNNALMSILSCNSVAGRYLEQSNTCVSIDDARRAIADVGHAVEQAQGLTRQLMSLSKGGSNLFGAVEVASLVGEMASLALRGTDIEPVLDLDGPAWVRGDHGQIGQAVLNLLINARQAAPRAGAIFVRTRIVEGIHGDGDLSAPSTFVEILVRDEGCGIRDEDRARIFEPYFTTKADGVGLGLAIVYSVIRKHQGTISLESKFGIYTEVLIRLPAIDSPSAEDPKLSLRVPRPGGRILILDDEPRIRWSLSVLLRQLGYDSDAVPDVATAVELFRASADSALPYTAALLDLTMPGEVSGIDVAHQIRAIDTSVSIYIMSGYADEIADIGKGLTPIVGFLQKPFTLDELAATMAVNTRQSR
jgi:signal transduction histidine kinase/CheY-like chemotaxis protein